MKRRLQSVVVAAVLALLAVPATAAYATPTEDTPAKPSIDVAELARAKAAAPVPDFAPKLVRAAQQELDLTAKQVVTKLTAEHRAARVNEVLARELGASYAGGWMNQRTGKLVVGVTDAEAAGIVRASGAEAKRVSYSEAELNSMVAKLDAAKADAPRAVTSWYPDVTTNSVVVTSRPGSVGATRAFVRAAGLDADAVRVVGSNARPRPLIDVIGGNAYYIGSGARCSVGFSVGDGFVTAGHCGNTGDTTSQPSGQFVGSSFPGNDYGYVRVASGNTPVGAVNDYSGGTVSVAGSNEAAVGSTVCRSGSTTGWHCGTILARNTSVTYPQGTVSGLIRTNVCAEPGDSGGSLLAGSQAQGVTSGGSGNCSSGGETYFQPVNEILQRYGLSLVTGTGGGGDDPPGDGSCTTGQFTGTGSLSAGQEAYEPDDTYYNANSTGTHTACLDGPDNADFDLYLLKWNGSSWQTVASATTPSGDETLTYTGTAGSYTYAVYAYSGSGSYTLELSVS